MHSKGEWDKLNSDLRLKSVNLYPSLRQRPPGLSSVIVAAMCRRGDLDSHWAEGCVWGSESLWRHGRVLARCDWILLLEFVKHWAANWTGGGPAWFDLTTTWWKTITLMTWAADSGSRGVINHISGDSIDHFQDLFIILQQYQTQQSAITYWLLMSTACWNHQTSHCSLFQRLLLFSHLHTGLC